ncbi:hypothetical protein GCM10018772_19020 [Streptomyces fumanus]|uniref:Uncharacterized protein n=1 Tax=Streptomyces fumanus TaxID=67302 RepID=A0A919DXH2_9ACTN|nr:hypothetical protein GCM10018772_19020 [Streptomyces fumanus]
MERGVAEVVRASAQGEAYDVRLLRSVLIAAGTSRPTGCRISVVTNHGLPDSGDNRNGLTALYRIKD